jgi:predicted helicase
MDSQKLEEKLQRKEIWANEILLLPYMAMTKNIETVISKKTGKFIPFETALWTDSFALMEKLYERKTPRLPAIIPEKFKEMVEAQLKAKVNVIISNPPWRVGRDNANVGRKNVEYKNLRKRIKQTYAKYNNELGVTLGSKLYDMYMQALRMATDRIEEGVIGFVLNNGWVNGLSGRGLRKALREEFAEIYVYDLRGDANIGSKKEGENVFPVKVGNCLLFLVKRKDKKEPAKIYYKAVKDFAKKEEKFAELKEWEEKPDQIPWQEIVPNDKHDWINHGDEGFGNFIKLGDKKNKNELTIFDTYSLGLSTNRDAFAYNFSKDDLRKHMGRLIDTFNEYLERVQSGEITKKNVDEKTKEEKNERGESKIKWDDTLKDRLFRVKEKQEYKEDEVFSAFYRPFVPMRIYFDEIFNTRRSKLPSIFPTSNVENLVIVVMSPGKGGEFDAAVADRIVDLHYMPQTAVFPLYIYTEEITLFGSTLSKQYNITDQALKKFQETLNDATITKEDIFYYVFGVLSTPSYVERFKNNLSKELPRVPILENFREISKLGRQLAELQLAYGRYVSAVVMKEKEKPELPEYSGLNIAKTSDSDLDDYVEKVSPNDENREITINGKVRVQNIPEFAFKCRVGNYSPIEWISNYLLKKIDKKSKETGIIWDPKISVSEFIDIVKKLITFSEKCLEIKEELDGCYN